MPRRLKPIGLVLPLLAVFALGIAASAATPRVRFNPILEGYSRPVLVTHAPGQPGILFIVEQTGKIKRATHRDGSWVKLGTFLDLSSKTHDPNEPNRNEQGLLGLAFHPSYRDNGRFYVNYTRRAEGADDGDNVVAEFRRGRKMHRADPGSDRIVLVVPQSSGFHNMGHLAFGPDHKLYIGGGDGGGQGDPGENGQDLETLKGKILRVDPLDPDGADPASFRVPRRNPYVGRPGRDEIWASGLRNPWRFSFDRRTGDLWIGDVGQNLREEIDMAPANQGGRNAGRGDDYGWDDCEGSLEFEADEGDPDELCSHDRLPVHDYQHADGWCAVTGGYVFRGPTPKDWRGLYIAGDWCGGTFVLGRKGQLLLTRMTDLRITSFGEDEEGRLYATGAGTIYRVLLSGPRP